MNSIERVDNAGKVFFSTSSNRVTKVFRLSCELHQPVNRIFLNQALQAVVQVFPCFQVEADIGFFWPRFKQSDIEPAAIPEVSAACSPLYSKWNKGLLYEVSYNAHWIHLDIFHALTDGMGASMFFRALMIAYLDLCQGGQPSFHNKLPGIDSSAMDYAIDAYKEYHTPHGSSVMQKIPPLAYRPKTKLMPGNKNADMRLLLPISQLLDKCHALHVTLTEYITAVYIQALQATASGMESKRPISIAIPVNLRKFYGACTLRNFFAVTHVSYAFHDTPAEFESIARSVHQNMSRELEPERIRENFSRFVTIEKNPVVQHIPYIMKNQGLRFFNWLSEKLTSATFTNLGRVDMPEEYMPFIKSYDLMDKTDGSKLCAISFGDTLSLHFTSALLDTTMEEAFIDALLEKDIPVEIAQTNDWHRVRQRIAENFT